MSEILLLAAEPDTKGDILSTDTLRQFANSFTRLSWNKVELQEESQKDEDKVNVEDDKHHPFQKRFKVAHTHNLHMLLTISATQVRAKHRGRRTLASIACHDSLS